jgi:hypothetical protein
MQDYVMANVAAGSSLAMVASVGALAAFYHDSTDINAPQQRMIALMRLIAKFPHWLRWPTNTPIGRSFAYRKTRLKLPLHERWSFRTRSTRSARC